MAAHVDHLSVVDEIVLRRHCAVVRTTHADRVAPCVEAYVRGGLTVIEITTTCPDFCEHITRTAAANPALLVGAGTILTADQVRSAVAAGAKFLVSPVLDEAVVAVAREVGVAFIPGCSTPSEMWRAHQLGCPMQKLFPEAFGGPKWVKSCMGALPNLRIVPTAGTTASNAKE